jgi:chromosome segregation ATPase
MSDLGKRAVDAPTNTKTIEQTTALRGWLTALLAQTVEAETTIRYRLADLETEAQRLRTHLEQTTSAIETLRRSIHTGDEAIGRRRTSCVKSARSPLGGCGGRRRTARRELRAASACAAARKPATATP